jgi:glycosyltransferase involved in cell wall biosynthesis
MRLFIQIPCYNEEGTLPLVLADIPAHIPGVEAIETLVVDDGSTDATVAVARRHGVDHVISLPGHKGLAVAFQAGLNACLQRGADIIVNTDGDNQYPQADIPRLIAPILCNEADIVIGDRQVHQVAHFSLLKRFLQQWGSRVVRMVSGVCVPDATSGFRAYSREAALRLSLLTRYTYTLETIIQAGKKGLRVAHIPIQAREPSRPSRLVKSDWSYVTRSAGTIIRLYVFYEPLRTFLFLSAPFVLVGLFAVLRFLYFQLVGEIGLGRHVQSLVLGGTLLTVGFLLIVLGIVADLVAANRALIEELMYRVKRIEHCLPASVAGVTGDEPERHSTVTLPSSTSSPADTPSTTSGNRSPVGQ